MSKKISVTEVRKSLRAEMKAMAEYYQAPTDLNERFEGKLKALPAARTETERGYLLFQAARLRTSYQTFLLSQWAKGEIDGPRTELNLLDMAKAKDNTARRMESLEKPEKAAEYRAQATALRAEADAVGRARREVQTETEGLVEIPLPRS